MAEIGHVKTVRVVDDQVEVDVMAGNGPVVTAKVCGHSGATFHPVAGDPVVFSRAGQEVHIIAVTGGDASTSPGETMIFSRNSGGDVMASILMGADGRVTITPTTTARVGSGSSPVSMSVSNDAIWNAVMTACNTFVPPGSPDGGAALSAAIAAAISGAGGTPVSTASQNLEAD